MGFVDAVKELAGRAGMTVPEQAPDLRHQERRGRRNRPRSCPMRRSTTGAAQDLGTAWRI